jgi:hypothetical protein
MLLIGIIIGFLFCLVASAGAYFYINSKPVKNEGLLKQMPTPEVTLTPTSVSAIVWLDKPQEISSIKIFKKRSELSENYSYYLTDEAKFMKVAEFPDGSILINSTLPFEGPGQSPIIRFIETKEKKYSCLTNYLDDWFKKDLPEILLPGVEIVDREIEGLNAPEIVEVANKKLVKGFFLDEYFSDLKNPQKVFDSVYGPIYRTDEKILNSSEILARNLYLKRKDSTLIEYDLDKSSLYPNDHIPQIIWVDGEKNKTSFTQALVSTCGSGFTGSVPILKEGSLSLAVKSEIGKSVNGDPIYQVTDVSTELLKQIYNAYKTDREYPGAPKIFSIEEIAKQKNHFLWKDQLGDWQIFVSSDFAPVAECGKPVIYLYPTRKTVVKVKIGASISKSEPLYERDGWQVTAYPDGKLIYNDQQFDSLFWEGLGNGFYPNLRDYGFVVAQKNLVPTLKNHLTLLGLNQKESADFLEFWVPRLPQAPYVRLTWFGTREMDILAPLEITPEPDTKIRIFLDFEGLEKPILLIPQRLSSVKRVGFTLIEWGGLLTGHFE